MAYPNRGLTAALMALAIAACARGVHRDQMVPPDDADGVASSGGNMVLERDVLGRNDVPVLDLLRYRIPGMQVSPTEDCPAVILRGRSTLYTPSNPAIYVDGERAANTCILTMLSTFHLERVEVYPSGIPPTGYFTNPYGVILIFLLHGPS